MFLRSHPAGTDDGIAFPALPQRQVAPRGCANCVSCGKCGRIGLHPPASADEPPAPAEDEDNRT